MIFSLTESKLDETQSETLIISMKSVTLTVIYIDIDVIYEEVNHKCQLRLNVTRVTAGVCGDVRTGSGSSQDDSSSS